MMDNKILRLFSVLIVSALLISVLIQRDLVRDKIATKRAEDSIVTFLKDNVRDIVQLTFSKSILEEDIGTAVFKVSVRYRDGYEIRLNAYYNNRRKLLDTERLGTDLAGFYQYETYKGQTVEPVTIIRSNGSRDTK